ncbi:A disintegrin and metalloproteinase with thrombospondin motifs 2-like [Exaiptasia diaphana]|uniref:Peptidase M12B propeptide domain-containing protein n=1 Tax=Exaiptasia diaphana TaxID=2652724 RepID=A0A913Y415_EXADI|nr:A disintegrin and metalloproteinase with thrombospondin motifs 2-like [Exaiptasia diaphana]
MNTVSRFVCNLPCHFFAFVAFIHCCRSLGSTVHNNQEEFVKRLKFYELVYPESKSFKSSLQVRFHAFKEDFRLDLWPNENLVPPNYSRETLPHARLARVGRVKRCFYTGKSRLHSDSSVALSNCNGLIGIIRLGLEEYFIEPFQKNGGHLVYRRSDLPTEESSVPLGCSTVKDRRAGVRHPVDGNTIRNSYSSSRMRRSPTDDVTMQLLVVVDKDMIGFHGNDTIEEYALTIMNMVWKCGNSFSGSLLEHKPCNVILFAARALALSIYICFAIICDFIDVRSL